MPFDPMSLYPMAPTPQAPAAPDTAAMQLAKLLKAMSPEQLQTQADVSVSGDTRGDLQRRLELANALRSAPMQRHISPVGAALGGAGHMLDVYFGTKQANDLEAKLDALRGLQSKATGDFQGALKAQREKAVNPFIFPRDY